MDKNILIFDLETTGDDKETARICQYSWHLRDGITGHLIDQDTQYVNPQEPIAPGATQVHGITDEQVSDKPTFSYFAGELFNLFSKDVIIAGYNQRSFDNTVLEREFRMVGRNIDITGKPNMDVYALVKRFYSFKLKDLVRLLFEQDMANAHDADSDVSYTWKVYREMLRRHRDQMPTRSDELNEFLYPNFVDQQGKLRWNEEGMAVFAFGKLEGTTLQDAVITDSGYLRWICSADFPKDVKNIISEALVGKFPVKNESVEV